MQVPHPSCALSLDYNESFSCMLGTMLPLQDQQSPRCLCSAPAPRLPPSGQLSPNGPAQADAGPSSILCASVLIVGRPSLGACWPVGISRSIAASHSFDKARTDHAPRLCLPSCLSEQLGPTPQRADADPCSILCASALYVRSSREVVIDVQDTGDWPLKRGCTAESIALSSLFTTLLAVGGPCV